MNAEFNSFRIHFRETESETDRAESPEEKLLEIRVRKRILSDTKKANGKQIFSETMNNYSRRSGEYREFVGILAYMCTPSRKPAIFVGVW